MYLYDDNRYSEKNRVIHACFRKGKVPPIFGTALDHLLTGNLELMAAKAFLITEDFTCNTRTVR